MTPILTLRYLKIVIPIHILILFQVQNFDTGTIPLDNGIVILIPITIVSNVSDLFALDFVV